MQSITSTRGVWGVEQLREIRTEQRSLFEVLSPFYHEGVTDLCLFYRGVCLWKRPY